MAEAALLGLATNAAMAMGQLIQARAVDEMKLAWGLKDELEKLKTKFSDLQAFLKDVGSAKHADKRSQVNEWLQKVKDAAYFADDIMDDYDYEILRRELEQNKRFIKQFGAFFTRYNPIIFRIRMSHKVSEALAMLNELDKKAQSIGLKQVDITRDGIGGTWADDNDGSLSLSQARQHAAADATEFVGRKDDEEKLLQMLCHPTNQERNISSFDEFDHMVDVGYLPDYICFTVVFTACNHCGFLDKAMGYFEKMQGRVMRALLHGPGLIRLGFRFRIQGW